MHILTGINEVSSHNFEIFPNPSNGIFTINNEQLTNSNYQLTISDLTGKIIFNSKYQNFNNSTIDLTSDRSPLQKGIYMLTIKTETDIYTKKLIIQ